MNNWFDFIFYISHYSFDVLQHSRRLRAWWSLQTKLSRKNWILTSLRML